MEMVPADMSLYCLGLLVMIAHPKPNNFSREEKLLASSCSGRTPAQQEGIWDICSLKFWTSRTI
jgi:hypothetical protein